jgi:peptidoglycan biosynthesis protein MviN/MurJ (putative lipid II flippase)
VATNLALIVALHPRLGFRAIALGTALGSIANVFVLVGVFEARQGGLVRRVATSSVARTLVAALAMSAASWAAAQGLTSAFGTRGLAAKLVVGLVPVVLGVAVYLGASLVLRIPEARELLVSLRRRSA